MYIDSLNAGWNSNRAIDACSSRSKISLKSLFLCTMCCILYTLSINRLFELGNDKRLIRSLYIMLGTFLVFKDPFGHMGLVYMGCNDWWQWPKTVTTLVISLYTTIKRAFQFSKVLENSELCLSSNKYLKRCSLIVS